MILIQPAILCLVLGTALCTTGVIYFYLLRYFKKASVKALWSILTFVLSIAVFTLLIWGIYDMLPMTFETVRTL